jgi:hypothetical protein
MRFLRDAAQIGFLAGFATELLPSKSMPHQSETSVAHVALTFPNSLGFRCCDRHQRTDGGHCVVIAGLIEINGVACGSKCLFALNVICYGYDTRLPCNTARWHVGRDQYAQ